MRPEHLDLVAKLLDRAGIADIRADEFKRYGSARKLYNFNIDHADAYG
jgi:methylamine---glutamate N-methyltransferase subunit B